MTLEMHYQEKFEEGIERGNIQSAKRMIETSKLPMDEIALYSGLSLEKVIELAKELQMV